MITQLAARIPSLRSMLTCVNHAYVLRLSLRLNIEKWDLLWQYQMHSQLDSDHLSKTLHNLGRTIERQMYDIKHKERLTARRSIDELGLECYTLIGLRRVLT